MALFYVLPVLDHSDWVSLDSDGNVQACIECTNGDCNVQACKVY